MKFSPMGDTHATLVERGDLVMFLPQPDQVLHVYRHSRLDAGQPLVQICEFENERCNYFNSWERFTKIDRLLRREHQFVLLELHESCHDNFNQLWVKLLHPEDGLVLALASRGGSFLGSPWNVMQRVTEAT